MIIHESNVDHVAGCIYEYHVELYGNFVTIQFVTALDEVPRTGDRIINNQLVKGGK